MDVLIIPWRGDGKRGGGAYELTSQAMSIDADAEDADLGIAVRQSLAVAESGQ